MSDTELAWAAGFFDGEGHTAGRPEGVAVTVTQKTPDLLHRFKDAVGGHGRVRYATDKWVYQVSGISTVQYILGELWPYLGAAKREQAREAVLRWVAAPRSRFLYTPIGHQRGV